MNVKQYISKCYPDEEGIVVFDGLDEAFIGIGYRFYRAVACYDKEKIITLLMKDGMSHDEAIEYYDFNIAGSYLGVKTPIIVEGVN